MLTTLQILAWNGGGSSNYSHIVHDGGYTIRKPAALDDAIAQHLPSMEELTKDVEHLSSEVMADAKKLIEKAEAVSNKFEAYFADQLQVD